MKREKITKLDIATGCRAHRINFVRGIKLIDEHFHGEVELVYVESGEIAYSIDSEQAVLGEGELLVIGSGVIHRLSCSEESANVVYLQVDIDRAYASMLSELLSFSFFCARNIKKHGVFSADSPIGKLFFFILSELEEKSSHYEIAVKGAVYQLIAFMCREGLSADITSLLRDASYRKIMPAIDYARQNFTQKITLDSLCSHLHIDKYNFCKQFKAITETTFFDYLCYLRIKHACELLTTTDQTVTEIALGCGFSTPQYFTRVFIGRMGHTPTVYRHMRKEH